MSKTETHLVVIGGGPGGYVAAFFASDLGIPVTLIDREPNPGGICLYRGCIPSKALLHVAKVLNESKEAKNWGIDFSEPKIDIDKMRSWKDSVIHKMTGGLGILSKQRKINFIQGKAIFIDSNTIKVSKVNGTEEQISFKNAILAVGSYPLTIPNLPQDPRIINSTGALELENIPKNLLVVGGGYIGLELGSVYAALGSKTSVVEMTSSLLPGVDRDLTQILSKNLEKKFASIKLNTKVVTMESQKGGIQVTFQSTDLKETAEVFEKVLIAIGRKPNSAGIGLEKTQVQLDQKGFVKVNAQRQTTDPNIYAIGDIAGEPMLAHKASHEGRVAVEAIQGYKVAFEPKAIPAVVFTDPEIAWCGLTETQAEKENITVKVTKFPWGASGRAATLGRNDGLTKMILDPETERILGVGIVGVEAGELIAEGVLAVEMGAAISDVKLSIHPHPTLSETFMESAEAFFGQSAHLYRPRKAD